METEKSALPEPALLKQLFDRLQLSVETGALNQAHQQVMRFQSEASPYHMVFSVMQLLPLKGVRPGQMRLSRFDVRHLPALVLYQRQWFIADNTAATGNDNVELTDVEGNRQTLLLEEAGDALVVWLQVKKPLSATVSGLKDNIASGLVLKELFRSKRWLVDVGIATLVINLLAIATSIFAMQTYDRVVPTLAYTTLATMVVGMLIIITMDWLLKLIRARILDTVSCKVDMAVSQQVFDHVMRLQLDKRPQSLGTLSAQVTGLDAVRQFFSSAVIFSLIDFPFALLFIFFIYVIGGPVFLVYLLLLPVAVVLGFITQTRLRRLLREQMTRSNERQGMLVDCLRGTESIRSANANWRFSALWQEINETINAYNLKQKHISNFSLTTTGSLSTLAYVSAIVVGVKQIETGSLTMGGLIACSILGGRVIAPVARAVQQLVQWQHISQALEMVNQVLVLKKDRDDDQHLAFPETLPESVILEDVRFSYGDSPMIQLNVPSLTFRAGERVALFGPVGSGKSTLLKVLAGMYRPNEGRIKLGPTDLWEIDPNRLAEFVTYLPQSVTLFKGTLRSNLTLSGAVTDNQLLDVTSVLGVNQIAAGSPQNMDMAIAEGGEGLSEGQRQLVGLARVFLARPRVWLLDEPTSSLDQLTEQRVIQAIEDAVGPEDILIISTHRPMIANKLANRVLVMQQGKIVEDGSLQAVMSKLFVTRQPLQHKNANSSVFGKKAGGIDVI